MSLRVMVIGAGIGGLTLANGLSRAGVEVVVYERDPTPEIRAQGARVHIDDRGVRALQACLPPERFDFFCATVGQPSERVCIIGEVDGRLAVLSTNEFLGKDGVPDSVRPGRPASRRLLRRLLLGGMRDNVRFDKQLLRYELRAAGGVRAHFADGSTDTADVLVGADGIGSVVRGQYLPNARVIDTGMRWLGGKAPLTPEIVATGLPDLIEGSFSIFGRPDDRMIVATVRFTEPPAQAAARLVPGLDPGDTADYVMWAALPSAARLDEADTDAGDASAVELWSLAKTLISSMHPDLRLIVDMAWPDQTYLLQVGTAVPIPPWPASRITLLGDAIHAMPPIRGSGVNTALQDAQRLSANLAAADRGQLEPLAAVADYEEQMRHDGFEAVAASVNALGAVGTRS